MHAVPELPNEEHERIKLKLKGNYSHNTIARQAMTNPHIKRNLKDSEKQGKHGVNKSIGIAYRKKTLEIPEFLPRRNLTNSGTNTTKAKREFKSTGRGKSISISKSNPTRKKPIQALNPDLSVLKYIAENQSKQVKSGTIHRIVDRFDDIISISHNSNPSANICHSKAAKSTVPQILAKEQTMIISNKFV